MERGLGGEDRENFTILVPGLQLFISVGMEEGVRIKDASTA
jgi:hypothetical protein